MQQITKYRDVNQIQLSIKCPTQSCFGVQRKLQFRYIGINHYFNHTLQFLDSYYTLLKWIYPKINIVTNKTYHLMLTTMILILGQFLLCYNKTSPKILSAILCDFFGSSIHTKVNKPRQTTTNMCLHQNQSTLHQSIMKNLEVKKKENMLNAIMVDE